MILNPPRQSLNRLLGLWDHLVDDQVGIVNDVYELPIETDDPSFFHVLSTACDTQRFTRLRNFGNNGGVSTDRYVAFAKAVGEAVERYCSAIFRYRDLILAPFEGLSEPATDPASFALYLDEQYQSGLIPWAPFTPDAMVAWTRGRSLHQGRDVLLPAAMVYVPYHYQRSLGDAPITQPISTGLAAGSSWIEATLSGLCEVIERDAFTLTWQARMAHPRIDPATVPASCKNLLERYRAVGIGIKIIDITSDIRMPTMMTIALCEATTSPAVAVAAATDPRAEIALIKSLEELAHTRKFAKQLMEYTPEIPDEVEEEHPKVLDQKDHLRMYCAQRSKAWIEFAWSSSKVIDFASIADYPAVTPTAALNLAVQDLAAQDLDVLVCDLTTPDIATLGLSVVRVVVPGMNPLFMGYHNRAQGGRRLYTVPQHLGFPGLTCGEKDNPYPHPFP